MGFVVDLEQRRFVGEPVGIDGCVVDQRGGDAGSGLGRTHRQMTMH